MVPRPPPSRACQRGSGWFEFAAVAVVLAILVGLLLQRVIEYQEQAEKTAVELTIRNLRSGLRWEIGQRMIHGSGADIARLAGANPIAWLERPPPGYLGERVGPAGTQIEAGNWYFDRASGELAYLPRFRNHLASKGNGAGELRWRLQALKNVPGADVNPAVTEIVLVETEHYRWF